MSSVTDKVRTSWQLLRRSLQVLQKNPKLYLFPVVSTLCALAIALFFFAPILAIVFANFWGTKTAVSQVDWDLVVARYNSAMYVFGVVLYLVSMFVATFM